MEGSLTIQLGDGASDRDVERLHQMMLSVAALRTAGPPALVRGEVAPGSMSGWGQTVIDIAPIVLALPSFVVDATSCLNRWSRTARQAGPLTLTGPRGSVQITGDVTEAQFRSAIDAVLAAQDGDAEPKAD